MRSMVEGARVSMLATLAPLHRRSGGPPPRSGEEHTRLKIIVSQAVAVP
jgi:hypothetical protein